MRSTRENFTWEIQVLSHLEGLSRHTFYRISHTVQLIPYKLNGISYSVKVLGPNTSANSPTSMASHK